MELITIFLLLTLHYVYFLRDIYKGLSLVHNSTQDIPQEIISVIIPFRNESENILESLKSISEQNYPEEKYEVIYVNDFSEDDSLKIICEAENE